MAENGSAETTSTPSNAAEAVEETGTPAAELPEVYTMSIGDDVVLGEEREDPYYDATDDEDVSSTLYRPLRVAPDSSLLGFNPEAPYADEGEWSVPDYWSAGSADKALSTASRYVVETYLDSTARYATTPEDNADWFERNKDIFAASAHETVRDGLVTPGRRVWLRGGDVENEDGSSAVDPEQATVQAKPAYDFVPHRWSGVEISISRTIVSHRSGSDLRYFYAEYYVEANELMLISRDGAPYTLDHLPLTLNLGVYLVASPHDDDFAVESIQWYKSHSGDPLEPLEFPYGQNS